MNTTAKEKEAHRIAAKAIQEVADLEEEVRNLRKQVECYKSLAFDYAYKYMDLLAAENTRLKEGVKDSAVNYALKIVR